MGSSVASVNREIKKPYAYYVQIESERPKFERKTNSKKGTRIGNLFLNHQILLK